MIFQYFLMAVILVTGVLVSIRKKKLTSPGAVTGAATGWLIFMGAGFTGIAMITAFFLSGTMATSWKIKTKEALGAAEENKGRRTAGQVIANSGAAGIAGLLAFIFPMQAALLQLVMAAAFASATADTLSSELGTVYGKGFYNILSFKKDRRGDNGVVSIEGTCFGVLGSILIAIVYTIGFGWNIRNGIVIIIAGTLGNITDSVLGATLERKQYLKNDAVNFLNTLAAAVAAVVLQRLW